VTNRQIDLLGDRIRHGDASERDLEALAAYRISFREAYTNVSNVLAANAIEFTGRSKSNLSIERKLRREPSLRLTQMQDIEGCRIVVADYERQQAGVALVATLFSSVKTIDRRARPSHGYRAVHLIANIGGRVVEIQVRTRLQDLWAQLSERIADELGEPDVKYGAGPEEVRAVLETTSRRIAGIELGEEAVSIIEARLEEDPRLVAADVVGLLPGAIEEVDQLRSSLAAVLAQSVRVLEHARMTRDRQKP
jgi:ppGpp synthetase/RelA/SpoT-type nucleotidyltranferase